MHLDRGASALRRGALVGDVAYGLLPTTGYAETTEDRAMRILQDFLDRVSERLPAVVALGPIAADLTGLSHSRSGVDRVLRVLLASAATAGSVARRRCRAKRWPWSCATSRRPAASSRSAASLA